MEVSRLWKTYDNFPRDRPVDTYLLATNGFRFTGRGDLVECISCNTSIEHWNPGDDGNLNKRHQRNCRFHANNNQTTNIPSAGSILDGTANSERHLPSRIELRISSVQPSSFKMRDSRLRLKTFQDNKSVWENSYKHKTISDQEFVDAGFFCLGREDRVKCWACDGILQGWDEDDDVWTEHEKWFPNCRLVRERLFEQKTQNTTRCFFDESPSDEDLPFSVSFNVDVNDLNEEGNYE